MAAYAADPGNAPSWYENIRSVEWREGSEVQVGARIAFSAVFLGKRLDYVYEIVEFVPETRLVMRTADGPFPMETTYTWQDDEGSTRMTLRNRGEPAGFGRLAAPAIGSALRRANAKDLERLKQVLESPAA